MRCVGISEKWEGNNEDPTSKRLLKGKGDKEQGVEKGGGEESTDGETLGF